MRIPRLHHALLASAVAAGASAVHASPNAESRTASAVEAADEAWTSAEIKGDAAFIDGLLLPGYRSIGSDGKVTTKEAIVANARRRGPGSDFGAQVAAYKAQHPTRATVRIEGDTAVLNWVSTIVGKGEPVASCDIFLFRSGRWHAIYSQHTTAEL